MMGVRSTCEEENSAGQSKARYFEVIHLFADLTVNMTGVD